MDAGRYHLRTFLCLTDHLCWVQTMATQIPLLPEKHQPPPSSPTDAAYREPDKIHGLENTPPTQFVGKGEADSQRSPPFSQPRHRKSGSLRVNGASKQPKEPQSIVEDLRDGDGEQLINKKLRFDDKQKPQRTQTELVSGRRAGAKWERSQYAILSVLHPITSKDLTILAFTLPRSPSPSNAGCRPLWSLLIPSAYHFF